MFDRSTTLVTVPNFPVTTSGFTVKVKVLSRNMADTSPREETQMEQKEEEFKQVKKKSRKRKLKEDDVATTSSMDTSETAPKRPNLPPISAEMLVVCVLKFWSWNVDQNNISPV